MKKSSREEKTQTQTITYSPAGISKISYFHNRCRGQVKESTATVFLTINSVCKTIQASRDDMPPETKLPIMTAINTVQSQQSTMSHVVTVRLASSSHQMFK